MQALLGHEDLQTTMRVYVKLFPAGEDVTQEMSDAAEQSLAAV